ncbi:MAG: hypothetical protein ACKOAU_20950 [Pirellula sp.]
MTDSLDKQRQSMHDAFFMDRDQELLDFLEEQSDSRADTSRELLRQAAKIDDPRVLDMLERLGVRAAAMTAFSLLPLVRLAWADTRISQSEFAALLKAAEDEGIAYGTPSYRLLSRWLDERPSEKMIQAWTAYAEALSNELDPESLAAIRHATIERAQRIAQASGGFLGLGDRTSHDEHNALLDLQRALTKKDF